jgi:hypothetical protein
VVSGESVDLAKLMGANCTLVISHQQTMVGRTYAAIDAVSKPTKNVPPSGQYDPAETRRRIAEWKAKEAGQVHIAPIAVRAPASSLPWRQSGEAAAPKSAAPITAPAATADFDPEVGF